MNQIDCCKFSGKVKWQPVIPRNGRIDVNIILLILVAIVTDRRICVNTILLILSYQIIDPQECEIFPNPIYRYWTNFTRYFSTSHLIFKLIFSFSPISVYVILVTAGSDSTSRFDHLSYTDITVHHIRKYLYGVKLNYFECGPGSPTSENKL